MFENPGSPRRGMQARNFTTNIPKILDLKSPSEQIFFRKLSLGAADVIGSQPSSVTVAESGSHFLFPVSTLAAQLFNS